MTKIDHRNASFPVLPKQYVVSQSPIRGYELWNQGYALGYYIARAPNLPMISIVANGNEPIAFCLGWVVYKGKFYNEDEILDLGDDDTMSHFLHKSSGRYVCLFQNDDGVTQVSGDAAGLLPLVYSLDNKIIASTPSLITNIYDQPVYSELKSLLNIPPKFGWYPFGLTPYKSIRRLLPNHLINLQEWTVSRVPSSKSSECDKTADIKNIIHSIAKQAQSNVGAILNKQKGVAHLTAGYDSRMLLATCKKFISGCRFETISNDDEGTKLDCHTAVQIAKKCKLHHSIIPFDPPCKEEINSWLKRVDYCIYDFVTLLLKTVKKNDPECHILTGTCGEVGRAYYWLSEDINGDGLDAETLLNRLGMPICDIFLKEAQNWLNTVPTTKTTEILDYAYIEQRLGCWGGPSVYGHEIDYPTLSPFNSHEIFDLMMDLPDDYRFNQTFAYDYIRQLWPELLGFPFNRASGFHRIKFIKTELKRLLPDFIKYWIKSLLKLKRK